MADISKEKRDHDPHADDSERAKEQARPGGAHPPRDSTQKVNPATHDGTAPPKPDYRRNNS